VKQFYKQFIKREGPERRKLVVSITPDPTLNHIQVAFNLTPPNNTRLRTRETVPLIFVPSHAMIPLKDKTSRGMFSSWHANFHFSIWSHEDILIKQ